MTQAHLKVTTRKRQNHVPFFKEEKSRAVFKFHIITMNLFSAF
jgi:hypothetical protein